MTIGDIIEAFPAIASWATGSFLIFISILPIQKFLHIRVSKLLSKRLKNPHLPLSYRWLVSIFLRAFDSAFQFRKSRWKLLFPSLIRSTLATAFFSIAIVFLLQDFLGSADFFQSFYLGLPVQGLPIGYPIRAQEIFETIGHDIFVRIEYRQMMLSGLAIFFVVGVFVDYISLTETRFVYGEMLKVNLRGKTFLFISDILFSALLALVGITIGYVVHYTIVGYFYGLGDALPLNFQSVSTMIRGGRMIFDDMLFQFYCSVSSSRYCDSDRYVDSLVPVVYSSLAFPFFLSTFFTSIWIWFYLSTFALFRFFYALRPIHSFIDFLIDIEKKPFKAVALVAFFVWSLWFLADWII